MKNFLMIVGESIVQSFAAIVGWLIMIVFMAKVGSEVFGYFILFLIPVIVVVVISAVFLNSIRSLKTKSWVLILMIVFLVVSELMGKHELSQILFIITSGYMMVLLPGLYITTMKIEHSDFKKLVIFFLLAPFVFISWYLLLHFLGF